MKIAMILLLLSPFAQARELLYRNGNISYRLEYTPKIFRYSAYADFRAIKVKKCNARVIGDFWAYTVRQSKQNPKVLGDRLPQRPFVRVDKDIRWLMSPGLPGKRASLLNSMAAEMSILQVKAAKACSRS